MVDINNYYTLLCRSSGLVFWCSASSTTSQQLLNNMCAEGGPVIKDSNVYLTYSTP